MNKLWYIHRMECHTLKAILLRDTCKRVKKSKGMIASEIEEVEEKETIQQGVYSLQLKILIIATFTETCWPTADL